MPRRRSRRTPWLTIGLLLLVAAVCVGAVEMTRSLNRLERTVGGAVVYAGYQKLLKAVERSPWTITLAGAGAAALSFGLISHAARPVRRPRRRRRTPPRRRSR